MASLFDTAYNFDPFGGSGFGLPHYNDRPNLMGMTSNNLTPFGQSTNFSNMGTGAQQYNFGNLGTAGTSNQVGFSFPSYAGGNTTSNAPFPTTPIPQTQPQTQPTTTPYTPPQAQPDVIRGTTPQLSTDNTERSIGPFEQNQIVGKPALNAGSVQDFLNRRKNMDYNYIGSVQRPFTEELFNEWLNQGKRLNWSEPNQDAIQTWLGERPTNTKERDAISLLGNRQAELWWNSLPMMDLGPVKPGENIRTDLFFV